MLTLPKGIIQVLRQFETALSERVWEWAKVLVIGAILAPGERTVAAILRVMGCSDEKQFQNYHRVLNRANWSSREVSRILLGLLVRLFFPGSGPLIMGIDETIERRRGRQIAARGVYRDPVRSSKEFFVKTHGLRWISLMLLTPIPWAQRVWALPFLTVLAPSERYHEQRKMRHKTITDWAWQMILQVSRWMPARRLVVVADGTYAVLDFLLKVSRLPLVSAITRLRLDACLYDPAPAREAGKRGRNALKGKPQPKLAQRLLDPKTVWQKQTLSWYGGTKREMEIATGTALWYQSPVPPVAIRWVLIRDPEGKYEPMALLCTDQNAEAVQIVEWFVLRWTVEVTFHEVRAHLGVETRAPMVGCGDCAHHSRIVGTLFACDCFCTSVVGSAIVSHSSGYLVYQSLADLFGYARFGSSASLARHLFFGVVQRRRHRSNSTSSFRSPRGDARFCCLVRTNGLENLDKVYRSSSIVLCEGTRHDTTAAERQGSGRSTTSKTGSRRARTALHF
jgi:hypothetical protein